MGMLIDYMSILMYGIEKKAKIIVKLLQLHWTKDKKNYN